MHHFPIPGCPEGILVDLSEPVKNSPIKITGKSYIKQAVEKYHNF